MKKLVFLAVVVTLFCFGCERDEWVVQYGEEMQEPVKVAMLVYTPSSHGSGVAPGMSMSGNLTISIVSIDIEEKYAIVFECQHGKFILGEHNQKRAKELFYTLKQGQEYTCTYRALYKVKYHLVDGKRVKELERHLVKYDFVSVK